MAFVFRGSGTSAVGNNVTSLTPALPTGTVAGDLLVIQFQNFGGTGARVPSVPGTWTSYVWVNGTAQHLVGWKIAGAGETAPTVTLTGTGVANDTQLARVHGFYSGSSLLIALAVAGVNSTNASADNIGPITGVTVPAGGGINIITAGKTNDFNGNGSLTNYTQAALTESTTGNDAGMTLMYRLATPAGATGNLTVTDDGATASAGLGFGKMLAFVETPSDLIDIELLEGATVIESWIDQQITTSIADLNLTLLPASVASITDLNALQIRATKVGSSGYIRIYEFSVAITGTEAGGGTAYTLTANAGSFTLTGQAATLRVGKVLTANAGSFTLTGQAATLRVGKTLTASAGSFTLTGQAATLSVGKALIASAGSFTLAGQAATLRAGRNLTSASGSFTLTGQAATLRSERILAADIGSFAIAGQTATLRTGKALTADIGNFTLAGQAAALRVDRILTSSAGSFTLSGQAATLSVGKALTASAGSFALSGQAATLSVGKTLTATAGSFTLSGQAAALRVDRILTSSVGSFTLSGQAATLSVGKTLTASAGSFTLSGQAAALRVGKALTASAGSFTLSGQAAALRVDRILISSAGSFTLSGQAATLSVGKALTASAGSFTLAGQAAALRAGRNLTSASGSFTLSGKDATLTALRSYRIYANAASFSLNGKAASFRFNISIAADRGSFALSGKAAILYVSRSIRVARVVADATRSAASATAATKASVSAQTATRSSVNIISINPGVVAMQLISRYDSLLYDVTMQETSATTGITAPLTSGAVSALICVWPPATTTTLTSTQISLAHVGNGRWIGKVGAATMQSAFSALPDGQLIAVVYTVDATMLRFTQASVASILPVGAIG